MVAFQECERMNILTSEIKRSLKELDLGLKVRPLFFDNDCHLILVFFLPPPDHPLTLVTLNLYCTLTLVVPFHTFPNITTQDGGDNVKYALVS